MLSDAMAADYGVKSLNYALIIVSIGASIIGSIFYLWTARAMSVELVPDIEPDDEIEYT
jgi:ABC-type transport system involved in cytochrome c biogenesis permease subunit